MHCVLDGVGDYLTCNGVGSFLDSGTQALSIWFRSDVPGVNDCLIGWGEPSPATGEIRFHISGGGDLYFAYTSDADVNTNRLGTVAVNDGAYHHLWAVLTQTTVDWWLDGTKGNPAGAGSDTLSKVGLTISECLFGARHRGASPQIPMDGALFSIAMYSSDPGAAIRAGAYNSGAPVDERTFGPDHYWWFGDGGDAHPTIIDRGAVGGADATMISMSQASLQLGGP
jgi:hypothetical protein